MLGIEFLNRPRELRFDGQEFMDYQKGDFYKDLLKVFTKLVQFDEEMKQFIIKRTDDNVTELEDIIFSNTGIKIEVKSEWVSNAAVDSGFMNPGNVLNIKGIEDFFSARDSSIGEAFKRLKADVLKGWVDTSTGKIGGDYSKVVFGLYINDAIQSFINKKYLDRYKLTLPEACAAFVCHECGHIFSGFLYVHRAIIDPIISTAAIKLIVDGQKYGKERVQVVKEAFKILEIGQKVEEEDISDFTGEEFTVYFNKAVGTRDTRRSLSLGTQDRASEIYADMYAVRMGCPKALVGALAGMDLLPGYSATPPYFLTAVFIIGMLAAAPVAIVLGGMMSSLMWLGYLGSALTPNMTYDSPYRRVKTILRDQIVRLNGDKSLDNKTKAKLLADAKEMEAMVNDTKPFLEGTLIQRAVSYILSGTDFRAADFEHYTDELIGHTLSLYKNAI